MTEHTGPAGSADEPERDVDDAGAVEYAETNIDDTAGRAADEPTPADETAAEETAADETTATAGADDATVGGEAGGADTPAVSEADTPADSDTPMEADVETPAEADGDGRMADVVHITPAQPGEAADTELVEAAEADDPIGGTDGAELATAAADLSAVQADDALLDALGGPDAKVADELGDAELGALLLAWRRDIDSERIPELIDADTAATEIRTASLAKRYAGRGRKRRFMVPVAAAAAVLAIGFTGTALAARDAQPGDTLWGLSKVLYTDHARSVEAAASVRSSMDEARLAIASDRYSEARSALSQAEKDLRDVTATEEAAQLKARHMQLMQRLEGNPDEGGQHPPESSKDGSSSKSSSPDSSSPDSSSPTGSQPQPGPDDPTGTAPTESEEPTTSEPDDTTTGSPSSETPTPSTETSDDTGRSSDGSGSGSGALESPALSGSTN